MMSLNEVIRERLNSGKFSADIFGEILYDFAKIAKEEIIQKIFREKAAKGDKMFAEFLLIETCRAILKITPASFYLYLKHDSKLMDILRLKLLKVYRNYTDFDRKRRNLKMYMSKIIRRNFGTKDAEIYLFDTVVVGADLNKYKKGKKIKEGEYDVEFIHSTTKGTTAGFLAAVLINFSKLSVEHVELVSKKAKKVEIWKNAFWTSLVRN